MKEEKTRKLICQITGKPLLAAKLYYEKKVEKAGSEQILHTTYICKAAKSLIKRGYTIREIHDTLKVKNFESHLTDEEAKKLVNTSSLRLNNNDRPTIGVIKTDPDVKRFIENITSDEQ
tara:strand:- start:405 stop:761 length:357 start_codon:yes stop_codon:yes gene_type:complete